MWTQLDYMTDQPVTADVLDDGKRIRIAYGSSTITTLDIGEAVDLVTAVAEALAAADQQAQTQLYRDENEIRSAAEVRGGL